MHRDKSLSEEILVVDAAAATAKIAAHLRLGLERNERSSRSPGSEHCAQTSWIDKASYSDITSTKFGEKCLGGK